MLSEVARGTYFVPSMDSTAVGQAVEVIQRHAGLAPGLTDACMAVLSFRYRYLDLLSLDERHFRVLRGWKGLTFRLLPADR